MTDLPLPASLGILAVLFGSLITLVVWLVRKLVSSADMRATAAIAAADKAADARVSDAQERTHDADARAAEWKDTAASWEAVARQQTDISQKAIESNKINDHFFETYMPHLGLKGENVVTEG